MHRRLSALVLSVMASACLASDPTHAGDNLAGDWLGCADTACTAYGYAGLRFEHNGDLAVITWKADATGEDGTRCVADYPGWRNASWAWRGDQVVLRDISGVGELTLRFDAGRIEGPGFKARPAGTSLPSEFPTAAWLVHVSGRVPDCD